MFGVGSQRTFVVGDPDFIKAIDPIGRDGAPDFSNPRQALQDAGAVGPPQEGQAGAIFGILFIVARALHRTRCRPTSERSTCDTAG